MKTFFSIVTGIVIALLIVVGIGDIALHHLFNSVHKSPQGLAAGVSATTQNQTSTNNSGASGTSTTGGQNSAGSTGSAASSTTNSSSTLGNSTASSANSATSPANSAQGSNSTGSGSNNAVVSSASPSTPQQNTMASTVQGLLNGSGKTPVDCSAMVQYVYAQAGIQVPRTVAQQATVGTRVNSMSQLQYGDIVFFDLSSAPNTVTFDGIYVGNGQFVARTTHGIMSMGLNSSYWKDKFTFGEHLN